MLKFQFISLQEILIGFKGVVKSWCNLLMHALAIMEFPLLQKEDYCSVTFIISITDFCFHVDISKAWWCFSLDYAEENMVWEISGSSNDLDIVDIDSNLKDPQACSMYAPDIYNNISLIEVSVGALLLQSDVINKHNTIAIFNLHLYWQDREVWGFLYNLKHRIIKGLVSY